MISTLKWREEFKIDELVNEEFPQDLFGSVGHIFGKDKDGRPVTYVPLAVVLDQLGSDCSHEATTSMGETRTSLPSSLMSLRSSGTADHRSSIIRYLH